MFNDHGTTCIALIVCSAELLKQSFYAYFACIHVYNVQWDYWCPGFVKCIQKQYNEVYGYI